MLEVHSINMAATDEIKPPSDFDVDAFLALTPSGMSESSVGATTPLPATPQSEAQLSGFGDASETFETPNGFETPELEDGSSSFAGVDDNSEGRTSEMDLDMMRQLLAKEREETLALEAKLLNKAKRKGSSVKRSFEIGSSGHDSPAVIDSSDNNHDCPVDDLTQAGENLNDAIIAQYLEERYAIGKIYTYIGDILIALNPFKRLGIYDQSTSLKYMGPVAKESVSPHIFYIANNAYRMMMIDGASQVCVISGESGAGKTESTKLLMRQIIDCSTYGLDVPNEVDNFMSERQLHPVEEKILTISPIIEAWGNAQTQMNNNSSRFGKYVELQFKPSGSVVGASLKHYLLEKARVCKQSDGEHNFHIFGQFLAGAEDDMKQFYGLESYESYKYLPAWDGNADFDEAENIANLREEWVQQQRGMYQIGFRDSEKDDASGLLAGILHTGNLDFTGMGNDGSKITANCQKALTKAAEAFCVESDVMAKCLTSGSIFMRGETIVTQYSPEKASNVRHAMAKTIYSSIFSWLINRIDAILAADRTLTDETEYFHKTKYSIGVLDIFGFEQFKQNGFDQLLINLANEHLQHYFNRNIFAMEMEEFVKQDVDKSIYENIRYEDNVHNLELFSARPFGIFSLLDEQTKLPKSTHLTLTDAMTKNLGSHGSFVTKRMQGEFGVQHYAGTVTYTTLDFLEKNKDEIPIPVTEMLSESANPLLRFLFLPGDVAITGRRTIKSRHGASAHGNKRRRGKSAHGNTKPTRKGATTKFISVSATFVVSLRSLMHNLNMSSPHFVRCIKPNIDSISGNFEAEYALKQLKYNGILATVQMRRKGFPHRIPFSDFITKFKGLAMPYSVPCPDDKVSVSSLLEKLKSKWGAREPVFENWILGSSKIFLKHWHVDILSEMTTIEQRAALLIQRQVRRLQAMKKFKGIKLRMLDERAQAVTFISGISEQCSHMHSSQQALLDEEARRGGESLGIIKKAKKKKIKKVTEKVDHKRFEKDLDKARRAVIKWWLKVERPRKMHVNAEDRVRLYFHGMISRDRSEEYLGKMTPGTFLVRVSERYHGYAISSKHVDRVKHYKLGVSNDGSYFLEGLEGLFPTLHELIKHYSKNPLPTTDTHPTAGLLQHPLGLVHDLGLGINHHNKIMKTRQEFEEDAAQTAANTSKPNTPPDDSVFDLDLTELGNSRWMRGMISRDEAERELRERGMVDGRFLIRIKKRTRDHIQLALSNTYGGKFYHHILARDKGQPWLLDNSIATVNSRSFWGPLSNVISELQDRRAPQIAGVLEKDGLSAAFNSQRSINRQLRVSSSPKINVQSTTPSQTPDMSPAHGMPPKRNSLLDIPGLGIARRGESPLRHSPMAMPSKPAPSPLHYIADENEEAERAREALKVAETLRRQPKLSSVTLSTGAGGLKLRNRITAPKSQPPIPIRNTPDSPQFDSRTGRRRTGLPRFIVTETSSVEDVCVWLSTIGQAIYINKFKSKKINGDKLFKLTEKKARKLIKREDDFVLFKRNLRQALAYAETMPELIEPYSPNPGIPVQSIPGRKQRPYRSVRRESAVPNSKTGGYLRNSSFAA